MSVYWDTPGPKRTEETLKVALGAAREKNIKWLVVSSTTGRTARTVTDMLPEGVNLVIVTHHHGYKEPGESEFDAETRAYVQEKGHAVLTTTHLFANIERSITNGKFGGLYPGGLVAATLRMFGEGTKVCVETATMALDAGLIPHGEDIMVCGGTGRGADTALIIRPAHAKDFFSGEIKEVVAKPRRINK